MRTRHASPARKTARAPAPRGAAAAIPERPGPVDETPEIVSHPDGWYWIAPDRHQQFGPFESYESARADRDVTVIRAEAFRKSEELRGQGDAERNNLLAAAFGRDPDFFGFYRSMQAYEVGLKPGETRMIVSPDSQFFRYFQDPFAGTGRPAPTGAPRP